MKKERKTEFPKVVKELGIKIKELINSNELKPREVANDAEMDVENLRKYINGSQEMRIGTLFKIAKALKIHPSELIKDL